MTTFGLRSEHALTSQDTNYSVRAIRVLQRNFYPDLQSMWIHMMVGRTTAACYARTTRCAFDQCPVWQTAACVKKIRCACTTAFVTQNAMP